MFANLTSTLYKSTNKEKQISARDVVDWLLSTLHLGSRRVTSRVIVLLDVYGIWLSSIHNSAGCTHPGPLFDRHFACDLCPDWNW